jgi:hypothetical protein
MLVEGCISHKSYPSIVTGMRRSLLISTPLSMSTAQPRLSIGLFKANRSMLKMLTLLVFLDFPMLILLERGYIRRTMYLMMENFTSCMTVHMVILNLGQYMF